MDTDELPGGDGTKGCRKSWCDERDLCFEPSNAGAIARVASCVPAPLSVFNWVHPWLILFFIYPWLVFRWQALPAPSVASCLPAPCVARFLGALRIAGKRHVCWWFFMPRGASRHSTGRRCS